MSDTMRTVAALVEQRVLAELAGGGRTPMLRVKDLEPPEITVLVERLRGRAGRAPLGDVQVVVSTRSSWPELRPEEKVPRPGVTPTTLRNGGRGVVLIDSDPFSDEQSWRQVRTISVATLLADADARAALVRHVREDEPPALLLDALEGVHRTLSTDERAVTVRTWIAYVGDVADRLREIEAVDSARAYSAIGTALPVLGLFADPELPDYAPTNRSRRLSDNRDGVRSVTSEVDDRRQETLLDKIGETPFARPDGTPETSSARIAKALARLLNGVDEKPDPIVTYRHWRQLVDAGTTRAGLGTRLRERIAAEAAERVEEYDALDVAEGIDAGDEFAARRLLDASVEGDGEPLTTLLTRRQVTALERMADPRAPRTTAPLATLLRRVSRMADERRETAPPSADEPARLLVEPRAPDSPGARHSRATFAWLFGETLSGVAKEVDGEPVSIEFHDSLLAREALLELETEDELSDARPEREAGFGPLELRLRWVDGTGVEERLDWYLESTAGLVALPRIAAVPETAKWEPGEDVALDDWLASAMEFGAMAGALEPKSTQSDIVARWRTIRTEGLAALYANGLSNSALRGHVERALSLLEEVRAEYVPSGGARSEVAAILDSDVCRCADGEVLLATHPTRLRWIATYLDRLGDHLVKALRGTLLVNEVNSELYFDTLHALSPLDQPPVATFDERLCVATRDEHWHQVFAPIKDRRGERRDWLADLDDGVVDEIGASVGQYLDAYPHKADGLHLLYFVRPNGARGLHRLVANVRRYITRRLGVEGATLELTLYVAAQELPAVDAFLQELDDPDHREHSDRPPVRATIRHWPDPEKELPDPGDLPPTIDVTVVPNLFGANTRSNPRTLGERDGGGRFDPLLDEPTELVSAGDGRSASDAVSRNLLPPERDRLLDTWSTIVTRQFQGFPLDADDAAGTLDYFTVYVSLGDSRGFLDALHACAHWVVTVDAFVGREQIEALEGGAEVIQVRSGVGANGGYRLVTSSRHGGEFIVARLERRLADARAVGSMSDRRAVAETVYRRARLLVPGIVLRSLGLGRTAAEMIGLVIARARVDQSVPFPTGSQAFESWLSLDEHASWSGGARGVRADLVRLRGDLRDGRLRLAIHVVEAKMRTTFDIRRAEQQLERSVALLGAAFGLGAEGEGEHADAPMWRRLVCRAVEQASAAADAKPAATHVLTPEGSAARLDPMLRAALREGNASNTDVTVEGVLVSLAEGEEVRDERTPRKGYIWLRTSEGETKRLLVELAGESAHPLAPGAALPCVEKEAVVEDDSGESDDSSRRSVQSLEKIMASGERVENLPNDAERSSADEPEHVETTVNRGAPAPRGGRTREAIARMQALLDALASRGVEAAPAGDEDALEGPGFYLLRIALSGNRRVRDITALSDDLQYDLKLDAGRLPRIYIDRGAVVFEIPKREEERYYVDAEELWSRTAWPVNALYAPLGVDVRDRPVGIDFSSSRSPHLLIGGMTGGGKSVALESLLTGLVRRHDASRLELRIIDPKGNEFTRFEGTPHVPDNIGIDAEDAIGMLERTCEEMDARYSAMKAAGRELGSPVREIARYNEVAEPSATFKWIVVVLDEFADLTSERDDRRAIEALLQRISQKARACGIHAIVATQKPSAEVISTTTRSNLGAQLALRVRGQSDSRVIMETPGAESLAGNGDAFLRLSGEEPIRLQCARVS